MPSQPQLAALLLALAPVAAHAQQIDDPANLMGERVSAPALADTLPIDHGAPALEQLLRKLRTRASMMLIVAHPDDEDSGLLTLESRGRGARVAMLTLTRGEGGQNLMTGDFNDALGLIRTQELLAEDRYTGTDQFFGTEVDFGFSKTKEESFKQWTHERVLYDAVRAVRLYRPLVLASVFIGGVTDGHGQHQVSGEITQEVFLAAADPKVFPEMIQQGLLPWAPLRVYARVPFAPITAQGMFDYATGKYLPPHFHNYVTGANTTTPPQATVTIHEGEVPNIPAFEGKSYVQWARQGLALQKTQIGPNVRIPPPGRVDVGYTLYGTRTHCPTEKSRSTSEPGAPCLDSETWASAKPAALPSNPQDSSEEDLFTGIDTSLPSLATLAPDAPLLVRSLLQTIDARIAEAQRLYAPDHLERAALPLRDALATLAIAIQAAEDSHITADQKFNLLHELRIKRVQLNNAIVLALSLKLEPLAKPAYQTDTAPPATTGKPVYTNAQIVNGSPIPLKLLHPDPQNTLPIAPLAALLAPGSVRFAETTGNLATPQSPTRPYFSRPNLEQPYYDVAISSLRNAPATPDPLVSSARVEYQNVSLELKAIVPESNTVARRTTASESLAVMPIAVQQSSVIVPPASVALIPSSEIFTPNDRSLHLTAQVDAQETIRTLGGVKIFEDGGRLIETAVPEASSKTIGKEQYVGITVDPARMPKPKFTLKAVVTQGSRDYSESYRPVGYPGLTYTNYYKPATFTATAVDVTTAPNLHIAYLPGTGDDVPEFLPSLGVPPTILNAKDLTLANLKHYDAILLGVRAYSAHPELEGTGSAALNDYARQGGIVIAQYNSAGFDPTSAPYPYTLPGDSAHNVVDEDQPVQLLAPANPLLTWPNRITPADFDHWIEERGHGFASDWSPEYTPLLETHDPDQDPQRGGLLLAKVGKGAYLYCAFALYRQLPEGVPGAYRLLANLLSYSKNPGR